MRVRSSPLANDVAFRSAVAGAFGLATAVVAYAWVRAVETVIFPQADPRAVVAVTQGGYLVRCAVALFAGTMGAFGGWALGRTPARGARAVLAAAVLAIVALAAQTWRLHEARGRIEGCAMTASALRALVRVHAGLAWAAAVLLCVALVVLWRRPRGAARWAALAAAAGTGAGAFATGLALHAPFQSKLRQRLFLASNALGWLFERKEHVAFGAIALLGVAVCAAWAERVAGGREEGTAALLQRAVLVSLAGALLFEAFAIAVSIPASGRVSF